MNEINGIGMIEMKDKGLPAEIFKMCLLLGGEDTCLLKISINNSRKKSQVVFRNLLLMIHSSTETIFSQILQMVISS